MYTLKVSKNQIKVISEALELYARLNIGQIEQIEWLFRDKICNKIELYDLDKLRSSCDIIKNVVFSELGRNAHYSIRSDSVPEKAKIAYDFVQVINHLLAWDSTPEGGNTVNFQEPLKCSEEDLPKIKGGE